MGYSSRVPVRALSLALGLIVGSAVVHAHQAFAQELGSTNFRSLFPLSNNISGGVASSTGFQSVQATGQTVTGESTSTSFQVNFGHLYYETFTPRSQNWRWYDDENNATPSNPLAGEGVAPTDIQDNNPLKLRISVAEIADIGAAATKFRLQFATSSNFLGDVGFVANSAQCLGGSEWCYEDGAGVDNAVITTTVLSDPDSCVAGVGDGCGTHNEAATTTSTFTHVKSAVTEYEFTIKASGALINTTYFFRLVYVAGSSTVPINTGETYPSLVTGGSSLEFTIDGINSGISTEGQTTGVATTPTSIPFGTLAFGASRVAAQRLTVSTNGTQGYKVYAFERQQFLTASGDAIDPVSGTNSSPSGWSTGCSISAEGCYGYHSGEDVLDGGSTRFAANDTYAQFSSTPYEVAYNNGPINNKTTDMVYRVEVQTEQEAGEYASTLVYVAVPVF